MIETIPAVFSRKVVDKATELGKPLKYAKLAFEVAGGRKFTSFTRRNHDSLMWVDNKAWYMVNPSREKEAIDEIIKTCAGSSISLPVQRSKREEKLIEDLKPYVTFEAFNNFLDFEDILKRKLDSLPEEYIVLMNVEKSYYGHQKHVVDVRICGPENPKELMEKFIENSHLKEIVDAFNWHEDDMAPMKVSVTTSKPRIVKTIEEKYKQNVLKDQNGMLIEKGDVVVYPHGGDHSFYGLAHGKVEGNTKDFILLKGGKKVEARKVIVVKTSNAEKQKEIDSILEE